MLDLNDVALFAQVVRAGSFAAAGRHLGLPSNTVSRRIQALEAELNTRLLQRTTRKLVLTREGANFHGRCVGAVDDILQAGRVLANSTQEPGGLVRVAAPADFFDVFPMESVAEFLAAHPLVNVEFILSDATCDLLTEQIDVAIRAGTVHELGYVSRPILDVRIDGLVASPAYVASRGAPRNLQDLATHDCVIGPSATGRAAWRLTKGTGQPEDVEVSGRFTGNTVQALRKATLSGLGVALLPPAMTNQDVQAGRLVHVLPKYARVTQGLSIVYPSRKHVPLAVTSFIAMVAANASSYDRLL